MSKCRRAHSMINSVSYNSRNWIIGDSASYNYYHNNNSNQNSKILSINDDDLKLLNRIATEDRKRSNKNNRRILEKNGKLDNELFIGQKLRTLTNEFVIIVEIKENQITVRYKGKDYERDISIIGNKLFVT